MTMSFLISGLRGNIEECQGHRHSSGRPHLTHPACEKFAPSIWLMQSSGFSISRLKRCSPFLNLSYPRFFYKSNFHESCQYEIPSSIWLPFFEYEFQLCESLPRYEFRVYDSFLLSESSEWIHSPNMHPFQICILHCMNHHQYYTIPCAPLPRQ